MADALMDFIDGGARKNLRESYQSWGRSSKARNTEEVKRSLELLETLAREIRILVLSKLADSNQLPSNLERPPAKSSFGHEVNFLDALQNHAFLYKLAGSSPDAGNTFVELQKVCELVLAYIEDSDGSIDDFKNGFENLEHGSSETWLQTMRLFVRFRNIEAHGTAQSNAEGISTNVTEKLAQARPSIARAMRVRMDWMIRQAATYFGGYELRSKQEVVNDRDFSVQDLLKKKTLLGSVAHVYVRYDEERNAIELFQRLESNEQVEKAKATEIVDSSIFRSAKSGLFLPLIGPAFGSPDQADDPGAAEVISRARTVVSDERYRSLEQFLTRVLSDRLGLEVQDLNPLEPSDPCDTSRARLVGELASLASQATAAFGHSLAKWGPPLTGKGEVLDDAAVEPLRRRIREVSDFVKSLHQDRTLSAAERTDLGVEAIINGLRVLDRDEVIDKRLSLNSIAWLDDLVWHALRWDAPLYPDSQALDLQLSLGVQREPDREFAVLGRTPASSGAALSFEPPKLTEYLVSWSRRTEQRIRAALTKSRGWQDPYELVAKAMTLCLAMRPRNATGFVEQREQLIDLQEELEPQKNVFVVDATFDQRMCSAIEKVGAKAAVVYPIDIVDNDGNSCPAWAMRRFPRPAKADDEYAVLWDECGRTIHWQDVPRIVVIKPFGAPLEPTGQLEKAVERAKLNLQKFPIDEHGKPKPYRYRTPPRFLFDDVSILKDMVRIHDSMPPGFRQAIHDQNDSFELFFLGYAIEEYGRRARMVADVRPANDVGKDASAQPRYLSQLPPSGLVYHYLKRAGFAHDRMPLANAMKDLALSLDQELEGAKS